MQDSFRSIYSLSYSPLAYDLTLHLLQSQKVGSWHSKTHGSSVANPGKQLLHNCNSSLVKKPYEQFFESHMIPLKPGLTWERSSNLNL